MCITADLIFLITVIECMYLYTVFFLSVRCSIYFKSKYRPKNSTLKLEVGNMDKILVTIFIFYNTMLV